MLNIDWKKEIFTIPNLLSLFRLVLIPVYVTIYLNATENSHYYLAAAILALSCLTDLVDGQIARRFNMISNLGKLLDPIADKATQFTLIICLATRYGAMYWLILLFVLKEGFQLIAMGLSLRKGKALDGALMSGKICTTVLFLSLIVLVLMPELSQTAVYMITTLDCLVVLIAFVCYARVYYTHSPMIQSLDSSEDTEE